MRMVSDAVYSGVAKTTMDHLSYYNVRATVKASLRSENNSERERERDLYYLLTKISTFSRAACHVKSSFTES